MRFRPLVALAATAVSLTACQGLKEALTAHVDVAARAGAQELSVTRLAELVGGSRLQIPVTQQNAQTIARFWVDYQLLGLAAARGDTTLDAKALEEAGYGMLAGLKLRRYMDSVSTTFKGDSGSEASYNQGTGGLFAARHILFGTTPVMTAAQKDSVRRAAEQVRQQVTAANFADMAGRHSTEPGAKERGGNLGLFQKQQMVAPFANAVAALQPGQISGLVETQFGYHIVQRLPFSAVRNEYAQAFVQVSRQQAESTFFAQLEQRGKVEVKSDAPTKVKEALKDPGAHRTDNDVLASFAGGEVSVARMIQWLNGAPQGAQIAQQIRSVPDSVVREFVRAVARNELLVREADRAGIKLSEEERTRFHGEFRQFLQQMWQELGVDPRSLADSGKTVGERERIAAARVESYLDRLVNGQAQPLPVPPLVQSVLEAKYDGKINQAGVDRAVERGTQVRAAADSAQASKQPQSQVPLPGAPQGAQPAPSAPQGPQGSAPRP